MLNFSDNGSTEDVADDLAGHHENPKYTVIEPFVGVYLSHMGYNPSAIDKNFTKHVNDMQKRDGSEVMHSPHKRHED